MDNPTTDMMPEKNTLPGTLLIAGLGLGLGGDLLIGDVLGPGPGLALWMALFGTTACGLAWQRQSPQRMTILSWSAVAFAASLVLVFRVLPVVYLAMAAVMLAAAAMVIMSLGGITLKHSTVGEHIAAVFRVPVQAAVGAVPLLGSLDFRDSVRHARLLSLLRGFLIALPLVLVFGSLFSQADMKFESLTTSVLSIFSPDLPQHVVITLLFFWLSSGLLVAIFRLPPARNSLAGFRFALGGAETLMVMGTLSVLFLAFVILQLPYLFGGRDTIEATAGMTLAAYARRGFFELVAVSALTLGVLLVMANVSQAPRYFRPLGALVLGCVLLILASALQRLFLYTQAFGLTIDRITAFTFMTWIAACLVLFGLIILRGRRDGFARGMTCSAVTIAFAFALANPAEIVIRTNVRMAANPTLQFDYQYLKTLGSHAVPFLVDNIAEFPYTRQCMWSREWLDQLESPASPHSVLHGLDDWRTWTWPGQRAREAIVSHQGELTDIRDGICPLLSGGIIRPPIRLLPATIFVQ